MPGSTGGSYRSLAVDGQNDVVYRSTTVAGNTPGMLDTVKKAFSFVSSSPTKQGERLIDVSKTPVILTSRYCILALFHHLCFHDGYTPDKFPFSSCVPLILKLERLFGKDNMFVFKSGRLHSF